MWRQGESPVGRQKGGRAWGGSQTGKGLERQHEELGLDSRGRGLPLKSVEWWRDMIRASGGRARQSWGQRQSWTWRAAG